MAKQIEFQDRNHFVIEVYSPVAKTGKLELLIDTGASRSIIKFGSITGQTVINTNEKIILGGAFNGTETTLGTTVTNLRFNSSFGTAWKFQIIRDSDSIPKDGILGADFICKNVVMDCVDNKMYCYDKDKEKLVQISDNLGKEKIMVEPIAAWEKHTKGIGTKLLLKNGYVLGEGLGRKGEGISVPNEPYPIKRDKAGLGLGT